MFNTSINLVFFISFTIVAVLFWAITLLELFFNKNFNNFTKTTVYECGFLTINKNTLPITLNVITLLFFVIIYEIEFILLVPFLLSVNLANTTLLICVATLLFVIILTLYWDFFLNKLNWNY